MPITAQQWAEAVRNGQGFTQEEKAQITRLEEGLTAISEQHDLEGLGSITMSLRILVNAPDNFENDQRVMRNVGEAVNYLSSMNDYFLAGSNMKNILMVDQGTGTNSLGQGATNLLPVMSLLSRKLGVKFERNAITQKYIHEINDVTANRQQDIILFPEDNSAFRQAQPEPEPAVQQELNVTASTLDLNDGNDGPIPENFGELLPPFGEDIDLNAGSQPQPVAQTEVKKPAVEEVEEEMNLYGDAEPEAQPVQAVQLADDYRRFKQNARITPEQRQILDEYKSKDRQAELALRNSKPTKPLAEQFRNIMVSAADLFDYDYYDKTPDQEYWRKSKTAVDGLNALLSAGDNFKDIMIELTDGENSVFGKDGEGMFRWLQTVKDTTGLQLDVEAYRAKYQQLKPEITKIQADTAHDIENVKAADNEFKRLVRAKASAEELNAARQKSVDLVNSARRESNIDNTESNKVLLRDYVSEAQIRHEKFFSYFGTNGSFDRSKARLGTGFDQNEIQRYGSLKFDENAGLPEWVMSCALFGEVSNTEKYQALVDNNGANTQFLNTFGRSFYWMNLPQGDFRCDPSTITSLANARQYTVNAIQEYKNGNVQPIKESLATFVKVYKEDSFNCDNGPGNLTYINRSFHKYVKDLMDNYPQFGLRELFTDDEYERLTSRVANIEAGDKQRETIGKMMTELPPRGSAEREKYAYDLIMEQCKSVANKGDSDLYDQRIKQNLDEQMTKYERFIPTINAGSNGIDHFMSISAKPELSLAEREALNKVTVGTLMDALALFEEKAMNPNASIMAKPDGSRKLDEIYGDAIRNSKRYKDIVNARTADELANAVYATVGDGNYCQFSDFKEVALDPTEQFEKVFRSEQYQNMLADRGRIIANQTRKEMLGSLTKIKTGLDTKPLYMAGHKDSKEIRKLREAANEVFEMVDLAGDPTNLFAGEETKHLENALLEAYECAVEYKQAKMVEAGFTDPKKWEGPSSPMGRARMEGVDKLIALAKRAIPEAIEKKEAAMEAADQMIRLNVDNFKNFDAAAKNAVKPDIAYTKFNQQPDLTREGNLGYMKELVANVIASNEIRKTLRISLHTDTPTKPAASIAEDIKARAKQLMNDQTFDNMFGKKGPGLDKITKLTAEKNGEGIMKEFYNRTAAQKAREAANPVNNQQRAQNAPAKENNIIK